MTREIEERGEVEEVWGGRRQPVVPPVTRGPRARDSRVAGSLRGGIVPRATPSRADALRRSRTPPELLDLLPFERLRRAFGREGGVRWRTIDAPSFSGVADVTRLESSLASPALRAWRPSLTPVLLRALAAALQLFPRANLCFGAETACAPLRRRVHVGVALYTARGLRIPVLRNADKKSAAEIEVELDAVARDAREQEVLELAECSAVFCDFSSLVREDAPPHLRGAHDLVLGAGPLRGVPRRERGRVEVRRLLPLSLWTRRAASERAECGRLLRWLVRAIADPRILAFAHQ